MIVLINIMLQMLKISTIHGKHIFTKNLNEKLILSNAVQRKTIKHYKFTSNYQQPQIY